MAEISSKQEEKEKQIALSFFELIAPPDGPMAALRIFDPKCKHHNPYSAQGMKSLFKEMSRAQQDTEHEHMPRDPVFSIRSVVADGNMVIVYTTMQSKSKQTVGFRQVHMFRFKGNKVIEYWDVTQTIPKGSNYPENFF